MPPKRSSKRLLGEEPSAEKVTKRARKPNANTLDAFLVKQAPIRRKTTGKRKDTKISGPSQDILLPEKTLVSLIPIPSTPSISPPAPSSLIHLTLIPLRKRANAPPPSSLFNSNNKGKIPYNISLIIILIINRSRNLIPEFIYTLILIIFSVITLKCFIYIFIRDI